MYFNGRGGEDRTPVDGVGDRCITILLRPYALKIKKMVGGDGFEPPNPREQSYSLSRLTTSLPAHAAQQIIALYYYSKQGFKNQ